MKNLLRVTVLAFCAIFMVANVSAQDNYNATTMGEIVRYYETAKWGQGSPFNNQCWTDATQQAHAKTGCVPTAFAIIMRHHGFPVEGIGNLPNQQTGEVFTDRTYDYSKMPLTNGSNWTTEQQNEVAKLMAHLGHAFGVTFGSGTTSVTIGNTMSERMRDFFNYKYTAVSNQYNNGTMYDFEEWKNNLKNSLDNGCPVPYAADNKKDGTNDTRHMFVVDGYTTEGYFHINFGWYGSSSNGWYKLDDITPTGDDYSWRTTSNGYDSKHQAFFNLMPNRTMRTVTASVSPAGAGTVTVNGSANSAEVLEGITATLVATANSGYTFSHWSKGSTEVGTDMTYRAKVAAEGNEYVANFYTIGSSVNIPVNYDSNMGSVTYNGNIVSATGFNPNEYSEVTLTAEANDGYMFTGWEIVEGTETTKSSEKSITFIAKSGIEVTAHFALAGGEYSMLYRNADMTGTTANGYCESWTLKNNIGPALKLSSLSGSTAVAALASAKNRFYASRSAQGITTTPITYRIEAPEGFVITSYELVYKSGSAGNITVSNATSSETPTDTSTPHTLSYRYTAQARSASNGVSSTEFTLSSTLNSDTYINVTAFNVTLLSEGGESTPTTYTINVTANPGTGGTATANGNSSATVTEGESVTLAATAAGNYIFTGWYKDAEKVSGDANYTFTPTESASYEARFVAKAVSNCNIPTDNTLRYYRFAIAIAPNSYTTDFGSSYDNVKQFWQECEDFMNEVYVPLGMCFDVVIDQRLLLGTNLPDNNGLPEISGVTDLINGAIGSGSYDVGLCISYRDDSEENTGLSAVNGAYSSTTKANGYAQADKWVVAHEAGHLFGADHTTEGESSLMDNIGEFFSYPSIKKIRDASVNNGPGNAYKSQVVANNAPTFTAQMKKTYRIPKGACLSIPVYASDADGHSLRYAAIGCSSSTVGNIIGGGTMPHFASLKPQTSNIIDYSPKFVADGDSYYLPVDGTNIPSMNAGSYSIAILVNDMPEGNSYDYLNSNPFYSNYDVWDATVEIVDGTPFTASISPAQNSYTAGSGVTVTWGVNNNVFTEDSRVRITMSTDYGKTFSHVLADDVRALDGSKAVTLPNVNVGNVDVDFSTQYVSAVRSMRAGIIRVEVIDGAAYTLTTLSPENGGGFNITGGGAEPEPDPTPTTYAITTAANPAEGGTAKFAIGTGSQQTQGDVNDGEQITLYATANTGYRFVNWTLNGTEVSTEATCNVTASQAANYVANFEETEEELPITGTRLDITFNGATGFPNSGNTNQVQTATDPVITISSDENNIGFSTIDGVKHPYLFKNCSFTISVPEPYRIAGYKLTVKGHNFDQGTITYTAGAQLARSNTATATIEGTTPKTVIATGLNNIEININVGDVSETSAGVIITALEIDYVEEAQAATEYPTPTGATYENNYLTSVTTTGGDTNIDYSANAHPGQSLVVVPGKVQLEKGKSFTMSLIAKSLGAGSNSTTREDMRYCHASLFTDFDQDFTFEASPLQTWGNKPPTNNVYGNYDLVMNITHTITVPDDAPTGESHIRMIYTNAWKDWPANGTANLDKGIVYDIVVEVVEKVDITANAGEGGSVTINGEATGTKRVIKGSSVTLNATPASGYSFLNWSNAEGIVSETAEYTFTANSATTLTANFERTTYTVNVNANPIEGGTATFAVGTNPATSSASVAGGTQVTLYAVANTGYRFVNWTNGTSTISNEATANVTINANSNFVANFEQEVQDVLTTGYYHLVSRATGRHEHLYNNVFSSGNTNGYTLQSNTMVNTNNGIWYITVNNKQLGVKNGDGKPVVAGNSNNNGIMGTYSYLNIQSTIDADGYTYYYFSEALNCSDSDHDHFKVGGINYLTTWSGHPEATDNQWRLELVNTDHKNIYNVVVECTEKDVYVVYGSGTNKEYAFNGGFFITAQTITAQQLTAKKGDEAVQGVTVLVEGNTIRVVDTEYVDITVSTTPAEGGTATINGEATGTKRVIKGSEVTLTATPNANYNFVNWTKNGVEVGTDATMIIENITANAEYVANFNYTGSFVAITTSVETIGGGEGGTVTGGGNYANGGTVTLTATPSGTNYRFMGWYNDNNEQVSTAATFEFMATANAKYTAKFIKRVYVEIIQPDMINDLGQPDKGYGFAYTWIGSGTQYKITVDYGTEVTINVLVYNQFNSDVEFAYWSIGNEKISQENPYTFTATEDRYEFLANFNLKATLAVESDGNGSAYIGSEGITSKDVVTGNTYTISAKAISGYAFDYWAKISGTDETNVSSSAVYTFVLTASLNETVKYKAYFKKITELEDGKAYRIKGRMSDGSYRYIYRDGNQIKWKDSQDNTNNSIFIAQYDFTANDGSLNLISAVGDLGWNYEGKMGDTYVALKTTTGTADDRFTLYNVQAVGTGSSYRSYNAYSDTENAKSGNMGYNTRATGVYKSVDSKGTTDFIFEEVPFEFNVGIANGSNAKLGTINLPFATTVHPSITAYAVTGSDENYAYVAPLTLEDNILPANTPVLVEAEEAGTYGFAPAPASANVYETGFAGTLEAEDIPGTTNAYILSYKGVGTHIMLYKLSSTNRKINANKAYYIDETGKASALRFVFGETTDIEEVKGENGEVEAIYDLQGRKLSEITEPGMYIINGKKVYKK